MTGAIFSEQVRLDVDYGQFYIWIDDPELIDVVGDAITLVDQFSPQQLMFVAARHWGQIRVDVSCFHERQRAPDDRFQDCAEISLNATASVSLTGWDSSTGETPLPVEVGAAYRVRYSVADLDDADPTPGIAATETYRIDLWPEPVSPPAIIQNDSAFGLDWKRTLCLDHIRTDVSLRMKHASEDQRVEEFLRRVSARYPQLPAEVMTGEGTTRSRLTSACLMLAEFALPTSHDPEVLTQFQEARERRIEHSLLEAAARHPSI